MLGETASKERHGLRIHRRPGNRCATRCGAGSSKGYDFERRRGIVKAGGLSREAWRELADLGLCGLAGARGARRHGLRPGRGDGRDGGARPRPRHRAVRGGRARRDERCSTAGPTRRRRAWLQKIAEGKELVVLAHAGARRALSPRRTSRRRRRRPAGGWRLSGAKIVVPAGDEADAFIVPARVSGAVDDAAGIGLFLVSTRRAGRRVRGYPTQDGARAAELVIEATPAPSSWSRRRGARRRSSARVDVGIAALCAEAVGADGQAGRDHGRVHEHAQAVRRADRELPGAAPPHRRRQDAARAGALDELLATSSSASRRRRGGARWRRQRSSSASRCASSASSASSCTAASASPTSTPRATTSSA